MKTSLAICLAAILLLVSGDAWAHHTSAMFDRDKQVKLNGTVAQFNWTNPHSSIALDVPNSNGGADRWAVECNSPNDMVRGGWKSTSLKPGDKVTVVLNPLRDGSKGGRFVSVTLANGTSLGDVQTKSGNDSK
jgi:hypothetical protein